MASGRREQASQAWIELLADDPEAISALRVARLRLPAAAHLTGLRRMRLFELRGRLPDRAAQEDLLHRSTQFYNPHKERCTIRASTEDSAPVRRGEWIVAVTDRGAERCPAAERWWLHETGHAITVRQAVVWALSFEPPSEEPDHAIDLATLRDRRHGLLCNPHSQDARITARDVPLPWLGEGGRNQEAGGTA